MNLEIKDPALIGWIAIIVIGALIVTGAGMLISGGFDENSEFGINEGGYPEPGAGSGLVICEPEHWRCQIAHWNSAQQVCEIKDRADDGIECTDDYCDPSTGEITHVWTCDPAYNYIELEKTWEFSGPGNCQNCYQPCWGSSDMGCYMGPRHLECEYKLHITDYDCYFNSINEYNLGPFSASCHDACGYCGCGGLRMTDICLEAQKQAYDLLAQMGWKVGLNDLDSENLCTKNEPQDDPTLIQRGGYKVNNNTDNFPIDTDNDGIPNWIESATSTDAFDDDTDNDGIIDGNEDRNHNGRCDPYEMNAVLIDTDGDGTQDGTEIGLIKPQGNDTDLSIFIPDPTPATTTDPLFNDILIVPIMPQSITYDVLIQNRPHTDGRWITWQYYENGNWDIWAQDLGFDGLLGTEDDGEKICISNNHPSIQVEPCVFDGKIVWQDLRNGNWDIFMYDTRTEEETQITSDSRHQYSPYIYDHIIAWTGECNPYDSFPEVFYFDLNSGHTVKITQDGGQKLFLTVKDDLIAWTQTPKGPTYCSLHIYNINDSTITKVTQDSSWAWDPFIADSLLFYMLWCDDGTGDNIYVYDMVSHDTKQLTCSPGNERNPSLHGDQLVWLDDRDGIWDWDFDIYTAKLTGLLEQPGIGEPLLITDIQRFDLSAHNGLLAWSDKKFGSYDIRCMKLNEIPTGVDFERDLVNRPTSFALLHNFPNPFNSETVIVFMIPKINNVVLEIYNIRGQKIRTLFNEQCEAGEHKTIWDGTNHLGQQVSSGLYICRMKTDNFCSYIKLMLIR